MTSETVATIVAYTACAAALVAMAVSCYFSAKARNAWRRAEQDWRRAEQSWKKANQSWKKANEIADAARATRDA